MCDSTSYGGALKHQGNERTCFGWHTIIMSAEKKKFDRKKIGRKLIT
jgi:hypothetical protein